MTIWRRKFVEPCYNVTRNIGLRIAKEGERVGIFEPFIL